MIKVGILVGHHGIGTGASFGTRDEWSLCKSMAINLSLALVHDHKLDPVLIDIDQKTHPWNLVQKVSKISPPSFLGGMGNIDIRVAWALRESVEAAVEFHLNSSFGATGHGHEIFIRRMPGPKTKGFGRLLIDEFDRHLGNKNRGLKRKSYRVLRKLHAANVPAAILEPAFITEDTVLVKQWQDQYVVAVKNALYRFFNL